MKLLIGIIALLLVGIGLLLFLGSKKDRTSTLDHTTTPGSDHAVGAPPKAGSYTINPQESIVKWIAEKPHILGYTHHGSFTVQEGSLVFENGSLTGEVVLDMTKLHVDSLGGGKEGNESKLEAHLKSGDFFEVDTYPTARLTIKQATASGDENQYSIVGDLTIKDTTEEISFPASLTTEDAALHMDASFEIDRTRWGITFGSASFFDGLAENAISDTVTISIGIVAE